MIIGCVRMLRKILALMALALCFSSMAPLGMGTVSAVQQPTGPNIDSITFKPMPQFGLGKERTALLNGSIDLIPSISSAEVSNYTSASNVNIYNSTGGGSTIAYLFFNTRRNPGDDPQFRSALARIINRAYICQTLEKGGVDQVTSFVLPLSGDWTNPSATAPGFDSKAAAKILDDAGYTLDSASGWRVNPKTGKPVQITIVTPTEGKSSALWDIGYTFSYYANALGIRSTQLSLQDSDFLNTTMVTRDFDVCVQYVPLAYVPFGLYVMLYSSRDVAGTSDYSGIHDSTLDADLQGLWSGVSIVDAQKGAIDAQKRLSELLPCVPVFSLPVRSVLNPRWSGVVNMPGVGIDNLWTYLGVHLSNQQYGGTLVESVLGGFKTLNPLYTNSTNDWSVLQLINSPLIYVDPTTQKDAPMLAISGATEPWTTPTGTQGMKATFKLRGDVLWQDGVPFTSRDVKFCIDYLKKYDVPRYQDLMGKIESAETPDNTTVVIYLNEPGYRLLYSLNWLTFMPQHIWSNVSDPSSFKPWTEANPTMKGLTKLIGTGPFIYVPGDLSAGVTLGWNPTYFMRNPAKPGLLQRQQTATSVTRGNVLTVDYLVNGFTGSPLSDPATGFTYSVTAANSTVVDQGEASLSGGFYEAKINTSRLGIGNYLFSLRALPYGSDSLSFTVSQSVATTGGIRVTVLDSGSKPIVGASVLSTSTPGGQSALGGVSGSDGSITFTGVTTGSYTFQASMSGYVVGSGSATVTAGELVSASITLQIQSSGGNSSGGVPGYAYEEILVGILLSFIVLFILRRRS